MSGSGAPSITLEERLAAVPRPMPVMRREEAAALTARQREILDDLIALMSEGFAHLTMADIAGRLGCSLRTLYGIAPNRDLLVLVACDRSLWATGRVARRTVGPTGDLQPLDGVRRYLLAATRAVGATTPQFAADLTRLPGGLELSDAHTQYLIAITKELLDIAVERGDIAAVDTNTVSVALASISNVFTQPHVIDTLAGSPKAAADQIIDIILRGLVAPNQ